jgi:hypothetical protein
VKTEEGLAVSTTMLAAPSASMGPPRPQLVPISGELSFGEMNEDLLLEMEVLKTLTPRVGLSPLRSDCSTRRPRSDSLVDFLNGFGEAAPTPGKCTA